MSEGSTGNRNIILIAALVLGVAIIAGGYLLGDGLRRARMADRAVTMRGLAERDVTANLASWSMNFSSSGTDAAAVQAEIEQDTRTINEFFRAAGFPATAITDGGGSINSFYDNNRQANVVTINRRLQFRTNDVMRAQRAYSRQFDLIRRGVELQEGSDMVYSYTQLNSIKPELIGASIQDARRGAERFAQDSGAAVGAIRSATQGYFSIGARDGDADTGDSGGGAGASPLQKVRVVTTIEFYLN
ncbi:MAG TPA: SIMPL domain-containing protein [Allosphingosinicella sp.]|nr:SIMPL domain-containing protein [Allosphingosinicella sp.]